MKRSYYFVIQSIVGGILLLLTAIAFGGSARTEVQILPFAEVQAQKPVRLGLIAVPIHDGNTQFEKMEDLEVLEAKKAGEKYFMGRVEIARILQDKLPAGHELQFRIPNQVVIEARKNYISPQDVSRKILNRLSEKCGACRHSLRDLKVPEVNVSENISDWNIDDSQVTLRGAVLLPLLLRFENGAQQTLWINVKISEEQNVMVARRDLKLGEHLTSDDYEMKWMDVTYQRESTLQQDEAKNMIFARYVSAGHPLAAGDMKKEPATARGQAVKVIAGENDLEVSIQATAEEPGSIGDMVKVKVQDSQKILSGRVVEKGVVRVQ